MHTDCYHKMYETEEGHWWFKGKTAIAKALIRRYFGNGKKILDVGCGTGFFSKSLALSGYEVTSVDGSELALEYCKKRGLKNLILSDACKLPFPDNSFDAVVALDILEHIKDDGVAVKEWTRVLKPGGIMLIFVPALQLLWSPQDIKLEHYRRYDKDALGKALRGMRIEKLSYFNTLLFLPVFLFRIVTNISPSLLKNRDELDITGPKINYLLEKIFSFESRYLVNSNFPIGVSLLAVSRKEDNGGTGPSVQVGREHYKSSSYDNKARWLSYWYQIRAVLESAPKTVLEVGLGNGLVSEYLKKEGVAVTTLDIDAKLKPDVLGSVTLIPLPDTSVDCVLAAEILEHIPFKDLGIALAELRRVSKGTVIISVPDSRHTLFYLGLKLPFFGRRDLFLKKQSTKEHIFDGQHYWEMGKRGYSYETIEKIILDSGFAIKKHFVPFDCPTKHFFVLEKSPVAS